MNKTVIVMNRLKILQSIFDVFQHMSQWYPWATPTCADDFYRAESMIQLLEVEDCGSVGGFDTNNPVERRYSFDLYDRFIACLNKHHSYEHIKPVCGFQPHNLGVYFKEAAELRQKVLNGRDVNFKI